MGIKRLEELPVDGRRVFLRLDLNVPLDEEGAITDDTRVQAALPTLQHLLEREARLVVASHLGRPKGVRLPHCSLEPVAARLADLLDVEIILPEDSVGDGPRKMAFALREGQIMMLENLRFYPGETHNDDSFAKQLSTLADMYVNDAFGCMHRSHASIVGVPRYLKDRGVGMLVEKELQNLSRLKDKPERPFVAVIGGAKVRDKLELLTCLLGQVDTLCLGGAMAVTFLAARGHKTGASRVEMESLAAAERFLRKAANTTTEILLPVDHIVADEVREGSQSRQVGVEEFPSGAHAVDIGGETIALFRSRLEAARTVFWNGPMGVFEILPFQP
ncbi:MAG: phosphoglycerate kinase, partial [Deltaproteobacteria bacterium]|nr:phosphoglycerate kinase [Deltaproteobacteria bacterium]